MIQVAEKYGTIPQKFTRDWWGYFWLYYKWHTISIIFAIAIIGSCVYSSITAEKFDLTLTYAGETHYTDEATEKIESTLSPLCEDIDGNGEASLYFSQLNIDLNSSDTKYLMAMLTKLDFAIGEGETYLFILNKESADRYKDESSGQSAFAPLSDWVTADISGLDTYSVNEVDYGVDISNAKIFKDMGLDVSDLYLFMRYYPRKDQVEKQLKGYNASINLANKILAN